jgi:hypothetical protein
MLKLKSRDEMVYFTYNVCLVDQCKEESEKLWSTDSNIIDVCYEHYKQLEAEKYLS